VSSKGGGEKEFKKKRGSSPLIICFSDGGRWRIARLRNSEGVGVEKEREGKGLSLTPSPREKKLFTLKKSSEASGKGKSLIT